MERRFPEVIWPEVERTVNSDEIKLLIRIWVASFLVQLSKNSQSTKSTYFKTSYLSYPEYMRRTFFHLRSSYSKLLWFFSTKNLLCSLLCPQPSADKDIMDYQPGWLPPLKSHAYSREVEDSQTLTARTWKTPSAQSRRIIFVHHKHFRGYWFPLCFPLCLPSAVLTSLFKGQCNERCS